MGNPVADPGPYLEYGALGLAALILVLSVLSGWFLIRHFGRVLNQKDAQFMTVLERSNTAIENNTLALRNIVGALHDRPCLAQDSRVREPPLQT